MSLVASIKSVFGLRGVQLELRGVADNVRPGSDLRATVHLGVRDYPAHVEALHVYVDEERLIYNVPGHADFEFWRKVASLSVPLQRRVFAPGDSLQIPISVAMPPTLEPTEAHRRYRLVARAGGLGVGPRAAAIVAVD
jgi:hypothetical protein